MISNRIIGGVGLIALLSSCSYKSYVSIETLESPAIYYLNPTKSITVNYKYVLSNQLPKIIGRINDTDSIAADVAAYAISSSIKQNSLLPHTNVVVSQIQQNEAQVINEFKLTPKDLSSIALKTKGEVILSLDYFSLSPEITAFPSANGGYVSLLVIDAVGVWRAYSLETKQVLGEYLFKQSYNWDAGGSSNALALKNLPNLNEVAAWVGTECGSNSAKAFAPFWNTVYRSIIVGMEAKCTQAKNYAKKGDWDNAVKIWSWQVGENKNHRQRWQAAYNLAVASEVKNNLLLALNWLDLADSFIPSTSEVKEYRGIIQQRMESQKIMESY